MMGNDQHGTQCLPWNWPDEHCSLGGGDGEQLELDHDVSDFDLGSRFILQPDDDQDARSTAYQAGNGLYDSNSSCGLWTFPTNFLQQPVEIEGSVVEVQVLEFESEPADHEAVHAIPAGLNLSRPPFNSTIRLRTKNEPWKDHWREAISRLRSSSEPGEGPVCIPYDASLPSPGSEFPVEEGEFLVTGAEGLFCTNVGKAPGREKLIVYDPKTEKFRTLPPLAHRRHPVLIHLSVDSERGEYKILVSGSACTANLDPDGLSVKTDVYDSVTGAWESCTDMPCPLSEYQTGVFHKDSEGHEFLCCVAGLDNTKEVLMFDYQKKQWVPVSVSRHIPLRLSGDFNDFSHRVTRTQVVGCGGSIFVFSEQENVRDKYFCIDEFHPDNTKFCIRSGNYRVWNQIWQRKRTGSNSRRLQVPCPEFTCVPLSATVIETGEIVVVFSEQESRENRGKNGDICIHILDDQNPSQEIFRRKRTRPRDKNWIVPETIAFLKSKEEGLEVVVGKDWEYISKRLKEDYSFSRSAQSCENRWGTLLKRHTDIRKDIQSKNLYPNTSGWANYWNHHKLLQVECYEMMDRILGIKPRKKSGAGKKLKQPAVVDGAANAGTSSANPQLLPPFADPLSDRQAATIAPSSESFNAEDEGHGRQHETDDERPGSPTMSGLCAILLKGRPDDQDVKIQEELIILLRSKYERDRSKYDLEILKERNKHKAREYAERPRHRRPKKCSKKTVQVGGVLSHDSDFE